MRTIPVKEIMVTKVITAGLNDSLVSVEEKMRLYRIRHLPVVDEKNHLAGIVTHRDLLKNVKPRKTDSGDLFDKDEMSEFILKYIMTPDPVTLGPDDAIAAAVDIMARNKYGCIPIVTVNNELIGIITQIDILKLLSRWLSSG